ncbi:TIGR00341 family protein [Arcobacter sp.]|uniref:TIGR00341 family protein n=1 Tax=unclassified Arcobacter TaxID=2593671 RepID=UPI003AFFE20A
MKYLEVVLNESSNELVKKIAENVKAKDLRFSPVDKDGMQVSRMIVSDYNLQKAIDSFCHIMGDQVTSKVMILPIEAYLPKETEEKEKKENEANAAKETIYKEMKENSYISSNYISLLIFSTIVATIGLIHNNLAIIIGAMVIAPLLGPNIAFSFAASIGDTKLMYSSSKTVLFGLFISIMLPMFFAMIFNQTFDAHELLSRTEVSYDSFILALASGAAASLSITTGLSSVLVGVMVSAALLPPAAVLGIMIGSGNSDLAIGAGVLLLINITSINLASKIVFFIKGIRPRLWQEKEKAKKAMIIYISSWIILLIILFMYVYYNPAILKGTFIR